jgi:type I restriction enzyme R subunit
VIDEAHRSVYRKYRAIFDYFDSLLVGLTATPRDEIDRDTYSLFELERGVPTDSYDLDEAVADGFLVPPTPISVPTRFMREGIKYDQLSDEDKEKWDLLEWEGQLPKGDVDPAALNKWLFNEDTVDKVLEHLMVNGLKVAEGDRLGKTIIFAKNHKHAQFIAERFDANYPHLKGSFARVIDYSVEYPQSLIDNFSIADKPPHIAISVDMLDTGIDVPEVLNLVFFKVVRSKTKFWQMIGRGTRLRKDLFGPGRDKTEFLIFDYCQNFEFFNENPNLKEAKQSTSLNEKLFTTRVELAMQLAGLSDEERGHGLAQLDKDTRDYLFDEVAAMNLDNFLVRAKRKEVEEFQKREAWNDIGSNEREVLIGEIAGLPSAREDTDIAAKQFDYIILKGQLALLQNDASFTQCQEKVIALASKLEELGNVPMVSAQMDLILEVQTPDYWADIDAWAVEQMRRQLRALMKLIEGDEAVIIYTDFEDEMGEATRIDLAHASIGTDKPRFLIKVRHFLKAHADHITIQKLHRNEQLTPQDLAELERILREETEASDADIAVITSEGGLGLFIRSLIGLDREAAKGAFAELLAGQNLNANQIEFINLIIDHLTERGAMDPRRLYESPFTDFDDQGVSGVFQQAEVQRIVQVLSDVSRRAAA